MRLRVKRRRDRMRCSSVTLTAVLADGRVLTWEATDPADVMVSTGKVQATVSDYWDHAAGTPLQPESVLIEVLRRPGTRIRVLAGRRP